MICISFIYICMYKPTSKFIHATDHFFHLTDNNKKLRKSKDDLSERTFWFVGIFPVQFDIQFWEINNPLWYNVLSKNVGKKHAAAWLAVHRDANCQFFSSGFITAIVVNPPETILAKRTSVQCAENDFIRTFQAFPKCKNRNTLYQVLVVWDYPERTTISHLRATIFRHTHFCGHKYLKKIGRIST